MAPGPTWPSVGRRAGGIESDSNGAAASFPHPARARYVVETGVEVMAHHAIGKQKTCIGVVNRLVSVSPFCYALMLAPLAPVPQLI